MFSGVAALIYSVNPSLTPFFVRDILEFTAKDLGPPGRDSKFGWGRINASDAVTLAAGAPAKPQNLEMSGTTAQNEPILTWDANTEPNFDHYEVWRSINFLGGPPGTFYKIVTVTTNTYTDYGLAAGGSWKVYYKVRAFNTLGVGSVYSDMLTITAAGFLKKADKNNRLVVLPSDFDLAQNYPNPFNPTTTIKYDLPADAYVTLKVFDILGREMMTLVDGDMVAGYHQVSLDRNELPTGVYFYKINAGTFTDMKKLLLLR